MKLLRFVYVPLPALNTLSRLKGIETVLRLLAHRDPDCSEYTFPFEGN